MKKRIVTLLLASVMALSMTACGTTAGDNSKLFFSLYSTQLNTIMTGGTGSAESTDTRSAIATPANFTFNEAGDYSFDAVENAEYYIIYMYKNGSSEHDYSSESISGEGTISGNLANLAYAYGDYEVTCVAYPSYTSDTLKESEPATATIKVTGEVEEPALTFYWDCFAETLQIIWTNSGNYSTTDYPLSMDVTIGGETTNIPMDSATTAYTVEQAAVGETYEVQATVNFNSEYVTNPTFEEDLGSVTCDAESNFAPDNYEYSSNTYNYAAYPIGGSLNFAEGGEIGRWKVNHNGGGWFSATSETANYLIYTATPIETAEGDAYTYSVIAGNDDGSDVYTGNFGTMNTFTGTLHVHSDNTFLLDLDAIYICTDQISNAEQWHDHSTCEGKWYDNGDGTATLSYNLGSEQDLGKGVR